MTLGNDASVGVTVRGWRGVPLVVVMLSGPPLMALVFSSIAPVLPAISSHFSSHGGSPLLAQWIMTTPAIGLMLGAPAGGWLIDRIGPRVMILLALALFAAGGSAGLWAESPATLLSARFLLGVAAASVATVTTWLIGAHAQGERRRRLIAAQDAIAGVAAMSAVLLSGLVAQSGGWRAPFAIYLVALPLLLLAILSVPSSGPDRLRTTSGGDVPLSGLRPLLPVYLVIIATAGLMMMPSTQVPFLLQANGVVDPVIRSRVIASSALAAIAGAALFPLIRARIGDAGIFRLILMAYFTGTTILAMAGSAVTAAAGCLAMGFGTGLFSPYFATLIIARAAPALRARAIGFMFGAIFLSEFLSPLVVLPLRAAFGVNGGFAALAALLLIALATTAWRTPNSGGVESRVSA